MYYAVSTLNASLAYKIFRMLIISSCHICSMSMHICNRSLSYPNAIQLLWHSAFMHSPPEACHYLD